MRRERVHRLNATGCDQVLPTLPSLVLAVALMSSSFMAASATAHCALEADQVVSSENVRERDDFPETELR